jgi:hypothetical protein
MNGYEVISVNDDKCIGHVSGRVGDFLIVEHGHLRKSHNPLPLTFADVDEANGRVVTTLAHDIVYDAPPVKDGELDEQAAAQYYGLAESPAAEGYGDFDDNELKVGTDSPAVEERAEIRSELSDDHGEEDRVGSPADQAPALLGDRQPRDTD